MQDGNRQTALDRMALPTVLLPICRLGEPATSSDGPPVDAQRGPSGGGGRYGMTLAAHDEWLLPCCCAARDGTSRSSQATPDLALRYPDAADERRAPGMAC